MELQNGWQLISANHLTDSGAVISQPGYATTNWHPIHRMPATVLEILEEDGVYPNLYYGMNFLKVPRDLYKQDWWYRTSFQVPAGAHTFWIDFPGINYRAEIWLNGQLLAGNQQVVGMYADHHFNVSNIIRPGQQNVLAVKVTPERPYLHGVELGTTWVNWINWTYFEYRGPLNLSELQGRAASAHLTATYSGGSGEKAPVNTEVAIVAASTDSVTLAATITSDGRPVKSGTATFFLGESKSGAAT